MMELGNKRNEKIKQPQLAPPSREGNIIQSVNQIELTE